MIFCILVFNELIFNIVSGVANIYNPTDFNKHGVNNEFKTYTIEVIVDDEAGVLARVVALFSGRGYNIDKLDVKYYNREQNLSVITIQTKCTIKLLHLIINLLERLIPVHSAKQVD